MAKWATFYSNIWSIWSYDQLSCKIYQIVRKFNADLWLLSKYVGTLYNLYNVVLASITASSVRIRFFENSNKFSLQNTFIS